MAAYDPDVTVTGELLTTVVSDSKYGNLTMGDLGGFNKWGTQEL